MITVQISRLTLRALYTTSGAEGLCTSTVRVDGPDLFAVELSTTTIARLVSCAFTGESFDETMLRVLTTHKGLQS